MKKVLIMIAMLACVAVAGEKTYEWATGNSQYTEIGKATYADGVLKGVLLETFPGATVVARACGANTCMLQVQVCLLDVESDNVTGCMPAMAQYKLERNSSSVLITFSASGVAKSLLNKSEAPSRTMDGRAGTMLYVDVK